MNLNVDRRNNFIAWLKTISPDAEIEIKYFPVTLEEALVRDSLREHKIGEKIIKQTWHKYKNELIEMLEEANKLKVAYNPELSDAVCFDVDGSIAERWNRNPFDYSKVDQDLPIKIVIEQMFFHYSKGRKIFVFSGRDDSCRELTSTWIEKYFQYPFELRMRKTGNKDRDSIIKKELYEKYIKGKYNLIAVYDDRPSVIKECWRELGIFVFDVGKGIDF
jgi:predicted KAP-like P-loop ATPase